MLAYDTTFLYVLAVLSLDLQQSLAHFPRCKFEELSSPSEYNLRLLQRNDLINHSDLPAQQLYVLVLNHP